MHSWQCSELPSYQGNSLLTKHAVWEVLLENKCTLTVLETMLILSTENYRHYSPCQCQLKLELITFVCRHNVDDSHHLTLKSCFSSDK